MIRQSILLLAMVPLAHADEIPHRKAGLWQIVTQPSDPQSKPMTHKLCLDKETEALLNRMSSGVMQQDCAKNDMHVSGGKLLMHTVCGLGGSQQTADVIITFSGDTSYVAESHTRFEPPLMGHAESRNTQEGKWVGACPADMQPGDMVMTDRRGREFRTNLRKLLQSVP